jgi:phosphohistidine swiveling domain-containing protein
MNRLEQSTVGPAPTISEDRWDADIIDLADIQEGDLPLVGSKAYHLGVLLQAGFPVPKGFCITTHAFRKSATRDGTVLIPLSLQQIILDACRAKAIRMAAIRSSAVDEDLAEASWAGIYHTTLRVTTERELLIAVEECFRSLNGSIASLYRRCLGESGKSWNSSMAVLVQETVEADAAGVLFTMNPLTRDHDESCINVVPGLAEPLASGRVAGDVFTVTREGEVRERQIAEKTWMLTTAGTAPVPDKRRRAPSLDPWQLRELARLGSRIEQHFGCPQDVEFAVAGQRICILQARPIPEKNVRPSSEAEQVEAYVRRERLALEARISALRQTGNLRAGEAIFSNGNIGELLSVPTPMSFGLFQQVFASHRGAIVTGRKALGYRVEDGSSAGLFELVCGHAYFNLEVDAGTFDIGLPFDLDAYIARVKHDPSLANYPELGLYEQVLNRDDMVARFGSDEGEKRHAIYRAFYERIAACGRTFLQEFPSILEPRFRGYLDREMNVDLSSLSADALVARVDRLIQNLWEFSCVQFVIAARIAFFFTEVVRTRLREFLGEESDAFCGKLLQALEGSEITQQMMDVEAVARGEMSREAFLRRYGHLALNELEIASPRIADDPDFVERLVREVIVPGRRPGEEFRRQVARRQQCEAELRQRLRADGARPEDLDAFFAELRLAQAFLPLRETIKSYYLAEYALIRAALLQLARVTGLGSENIFYLYPEELAECLGPLEALRTKIARRREERRLAEVLAKQKRMPAVIFGSSLDLIGAFPEIAACRLCKGTSVAPGKAIGVVRIVEAEKIDVSRFMNELTGEDVIVMRCANLGVAPLLRKVAALIIDIGGVLSHGACQARESGIPAVVMENASMVLRNGMRVQVDGDAGTVSLLDGGDAA